MNPSMCPEYTIHMEQKGEAKPLRMCVKDMRDPVLPDFRLE